MVELGGVSHAKKTIRLATATGEISQVGLPVRSPPYSTSVAEVPRLTTPTRRPLTVPVSIPRSSATTVQPSFLAVRSTWAKSATDRDRRVSLAATRPSARPAVSSPSAHCNPARRVWAPVTPSSGSAHTISQSFSPVARSMAVRWASMPYAGSPDASCCLGPAQVADHPPLHEVSQKRRSPAEAGQSMVGGVVSTAPRWPRGPRGTWTGQPSCSCPQAVWSRRPESVVRVRVQEIVDSLDPGDG